MRSGLAPHTSSRASQPRQQASSSCSLCSLFPQGVGKEQIKYHNILPRSESKHRAKQVELMSTIRTFCFFFTFDSDGSLAQLSSNDPNETNREEVHRWPRDATAPGKSKPGQES